jgi:two-component system, NtrC family, sensor histidine kinase HydH
MEQSLSPPGSRLPLPSWAMNLTGFGLLIALVLAVFFWQMTTVDNALQRNTLGRSRMIAAIIEENLRNAALARTTIDTVVTSFLRDKARFVDYLNSIDPLQPEELAALARETGLPGIGLVRMDGEMIAGPEDWQPDESACTLPPETLHYDLDQRTALLAAPATSTGVRCILIGLNAEAIVQLQQKTSPPALLAALSSLPGIHFVRLDESSAPPTGTTVRLIAEDGKHTAEALLTTSMGTLTVGLDAAAHHSRIQQMQRQFLLFAALLLGLGLFFSWLLYRFQQANIARTRSFERLLAKEHEAAALGRATATIAHEVRNPLNAISMGLQRFDLESNHLDAEQRQLIGAMKEAVRRAGAIINELQRFTRELKPRLQPVDPGDILQQLLLLYRQRCADQQIEVTINQQGSVPIEADHDLVMELLENLLTNSIEAQPDGGFVRIDHASKGEGMELTMVNGGCTLTVEQIERLGEPYFTTKTRGTGLGLALCHRITEAHGGLLRIVVDRQRQQLTAKLFLPGNVAGRRPENRQTWLDAKGGNLQ